jgi:hypothetical protein
MLHENSPKEYCSPDDSHEQRPDDEETPAMVREEGIVPQKNGSVSRLALLMFTGKITRLRMHNTERLKAFV